MHYIGSKTKLIEFLKSEMKNVVGNDLSRMVFCDLFAGTGTVGRAFKNDVKRIISNDLEYYSYILNYAGIKNQQEPSVYQKYLDELGGLHGRDDGIIYNNYALGSGSGRNYFSDENAKRIDSMRMQIEEWYKGEEIDRDGYYFLLASLLQSVEKVANTASLYGAFLKTLKKTAQQKIMVLPLHYEPSKNKNEVFNQDANELIKEIEGDILYLDPPYNHRQYGANYHILNTIALYDAFTPRGKTGVREYVSSAYCKKTEVYKSFEALIKDARFRTIFMSYSNEALMNEDEIRNIMSKYGSYSVLKQEHQRFKSYKKYHPKTYEYLHILIKDQF
jgi:adenine-specific DNA-methyltransferase